MTNISPRETALREELAELVAEYAPQRFALCWTDWVADDGGVAYWGLRFPGGRTVLVGDSGRDVGFFSSTDNARRIVGRRHPLELIWLDSPCSP